MPLVQIDMWTGRTTAQKSELVARMTDAVVRTCGSPQETVTVIIREHDRGNWADGGILASCDGYPLSPPQRDEDSQSGQEPGKWNRS